MVNNFLLFLMYDCLKYIKTLTVLYFPFLLKMFPNLSVQSALQMAQLCFPSWGPRASPFSVSVPHRVTVRVSHWQREDGAGPVFQAFRGGSIVQPPQQRGETQARKGPQAASPVWWVSLGVGARVTESPSYPQTGLEPAPVPEAHPEGARLCTMCGFQRLRGGAAGGSYFPQALPDQPRSPPL